MSMHRPDGRTPSQIRHISVTYDVYGYADASVLFEQGNTKVLVGVSLQNTIPPFLKGTKTGWLSAEYAMLPHATHQRSQRESNQAQRNSRSVEISRLIGRCLRLCVDLDSLGERNIVIDCDVLQADGGTRVACITAASLALKKACNQWASSGITEKNIFKEQIAAISTGIISGIPVVDLMYAEDTRAEADFNIILTEKNAIVEIQGTSEKSAIQWHIFDHLKELAQAGIKEIFKQINTPTAPAKQAFFSLGNRLTL